VLHSFRIIEQEASSHVKNKMKRNILYLINVITEMGRTENAAKKSRNRKTTQHNECHMSGGQNGLPSLKRLFSDCRRCKTFEKFRLRPNVSCFQTVVNLLATRSLAILHIPTYSAIFRLEIQALVLFAQFSDCFGFHRERDKIQTAWIILHFRLLPRC
jgi:hypothetical protein